MTGSLIPQELYLLERYSSVEYFGEMRTAWRELVDLSQRCLDVYVRALPPDYRRRPLYEQPDLVWGERVIVNFVKTMEYMDANFVRLEKGDKRGLGSAYGVHNSFVGFARDYSADWMAEPQVAKIIPNALREFDRLMDRAILRSSNIGRTIGAEWLLGELTLLYYPGWGPLDLPSQWHTYRLNSSLTVPSDQPVTRSGCYVPDEPDCAAQFLIEGDDAALAQIGRDPLTTQRVRQAPTVWTLVERVSDTGGGVPSETPFPHLPGLDPPAMFAMSGENCPCSGLWSPRADVPLPDGYVQRYSPMPMAEWRDSEGRFHQRAIKWQLVKVMN